MTPSLPPSRISHRSLGGPDLNYLYATAGPSSSRDGGGDDDVYDDDSIDSSGRRRRRRRKKKPVRRGLRSDPRALRGTSLYLGGEEGPNKKIYCIPGHATRVLCIDTITDDVYPIGPEYDMSNCILGGKFKWLRGIVVGDIVYGLPCHSDRVLRIDTRTDKVGTMRIPYEEYFDDEPIIEGEGGVADGDDASAADNDDGLDNAEEKKANRIKTSLAHQERHLPWKYHGGSISPHDGCIYAIPQSSRRVLRIDPVTEKVSFVGPDLVGRCKWYGGVVGNTDGAIYGIPQNAGGVLRIDASGAADNACGPGPPESRVLVTVHGSFPPNSHNWHGAAASSTEDGTIVCVPANADAVLCVVPSSRAAYPPPDSSSSSDAASFPEPELYVLEGDDPSDVSTGRHRSDGKYKYLGAMAGTDGRVYCFPSGSERVLQIDTVSRAVRSVGPNLRDAGMEMLHQNKWQNGLTSEGEGCVYAIPLGAATVLRIRTGRGRRGGGDGPTSSSSGDSGEDEVPEVTTWKLPSPSDVLQKWEGGVMATNGCMYCMPNNHKAVLQIVPHTVPSREGLHRARDERERGREIEREAEEAERRRETERRTAEKEGRRERRMRDREGRGGDERRRGGGDEPGGATPGSSDAEGGEEKKTEDEATDRHVIPSDDATEESSSEEATGSGIEVRQKSKDGTDSGSGGATRTDLSVLPDGGVPPDDDAPYKYRSGIPTLRSSAHRVKYSLDQRKHDPDPRGDDGESTNTTFLPARLCDEDVSAYPAPEYDFHGAVVDILRRCDVDIVGGFRSSSSSDGGGASATIPRLEDFDVPVYSLVRECQRGKLERAQEYLSDAVANDADFLRLFDDFVVDAILPRLKARLRSAVAHDDGNSPVTFFYQRPPTLRIQPGPARASVRAHNDAEYGRECALAQFIPSREFRIPRDLTIARCVSLPLNLSQIKTAS